MGTPERLTKAVLRQLTLENLHIRKQLIEKEIDRIEKEIEQDRGGSGTQKCECVQ